MRSQFSSTAGTIATKSSDNQVEDEEVVMGKSKHILIKSDSLYAVDPDFRNRVEDVWLVFKSRRETVYLGPTMLSRSMVSYEISSALEFIELYEGRLARGEAKTTESIVSNPEPADIFEIDNAEMLECFKRELAFWQGIEANWADGKTFTFFESPHEPGCPNICVNADSLSRATIEAGLEFYLRDKGYLKPGSQPRFHWKRPEVIPPRS